MNKAPMSSMNLRNKNLGKTGSSSSSSNQCVAGPIGASYLNQFDNSLSCQIPGPTGRSGSSASQSYALALPPEVMSLVAAANNEQLLQMCSANQDPACYLPAAAKRKFDDAAISRTDSLLLMADKELKVIVDLVRSDTTVENSKKMADLLHTAYDQRNLPIIISQLGILGKVLVKDYGGERYIIIKGQAGLRGGSMMNWLTNGSVKGTRYLEKTLSMHLEATTVERLETGVEGTAVSVVIVATIDVVEYFLDDKETLNDLGVNLTVDIAKAIIEGAGTTFAVIIAASFGAPVVIGAIAGIAAGFVISYWLDKPEITAEFKEWVKGRYDSVEQFKSGPMYSLAANQCYITGYSQSTVLSIANGDDLVLGSYVSKVLRQHIMIQDYYSTPALMLNGRSL